MLAGVIGANSLALAQPFLSTWLHMLTAFRSNHCHALTVGLVRSL